MTIRHLKIFLAVADSGTMSQAASSLYISQPTVSQAVRELEEHYHVLLFERLSKKLYITEEGKKLLSYARSAVEQFDILEDRMLDAYEQEQLRIGMTLTVGHCLLPGLLRDLEQRCPRTDTYTFVGNTSIIEEKLLHAELGLGIVEGDVKSHELTSIPKIKDRLVLACARTHPLAGKPFITPGELENRKFVMREAGSGTRELFEKYLERYRLGIKNVLETDSIEIIRHAVLKKECMAVISARLIEKDIRSGDIYTFRPGGLEWERRFSLVFHKNKFVTPAMEELGRLLEEYQEPKAAENIPEGEICGMTADK